MQNHKRLYTDTERKKKLEELFAARRQKFCARIQGVSF